MGKATSIRRGVTLIEVMVVFVIIAVLFGLILVAVQYSRESSRRTACQSNLRQLVAGMHEYIAIHRHLPDPAPTGLMGGWSIAILPFLEEENLAHALAQNLSLAALNNSTLARQRPALLTCPSMADRDSSIPNIPVGHYVLDIPEYKSLARAPVPIARRLVREGWRLGDMRYNSRPWINGTPWIVGAEQSGIYLGRNIHDGPHSGGYNATMPHENNTVRYIH
jgi:prepilin-type N-terminal cleavage/methylation domain-containing protein